MNTDPASFPEKWGYQFTPTYHRKLNPSIDPTKVKLPESFTVLITGASKGLGAHTAFAYARAGVSNLILTARTSSALDAIAKEIANISPTIKTLCIPCDVSQESQVQGLAEKVKQTFNRLDVLINNAGITTDFFLDPAAEAGKRFSDGLLEGSSENFQYVFNVNFYGTYFPTRYLLPLLIATEGGAKTVINVTSAAAHNASTALTPVAYNLSKLAVTRLAEHVDSTHRAREGVLAYAVHPGSVVTPLTDGTPPIWESILVDDIDLHGGFCVWLTKERREWLSGRYLMANWDVNELEGMKDDIVKNQKLKFTMDI